MHITSLLRFLRRAVLMNAVEGEGGGSTSGGAVAAPVAAPAADPAGTAAPASAPATPAAPAVAAPAAPEAPKTMLEAIERSMAPKVETDPATGQPRDPLGRFAPKTEAERAAAAAAATLPGAQPAVAKPAADPAKPAAVEDPTKMPEGLSVPAQQRFQQLANTNRELTQKVEQVENALGYVQQTFQQHGVQREQFEQAVGVIGMLNRGDFAGAQRVLMQQLQQIAIHTGQPVGAVDALQGYPDLRQAVDGMQVTEAHALEIARGRQQQATQQATQQRQQETQQAQQQSQQAVQRGTQEVDAFCKQMAATDVDYPAIEAQLLPEIGALIKDLPPASWRGVVSTQYKLMKQAAAVARTSSASAGGGNPLRPTGQVSPAVAPKTMHEAMFGHPARA